MSPPRLSVRDLRKAYGSIEALRGISFEAEPGEIFGLLGPNGAGKTTALECVLGLRKPDSGQIFFGDLEINAHPEFAKAKIGAQLQSAQLQDKITPREALRLFGTFYPNSRSPDALLAEYKLTDKADAAFASLSGGQKQRLFLALAFVHSPELVILDEPTVGLDPEARRELHLAIRAARARGCTLVLSTHDLAEAEQLCDRVAILDRGRIIAANTVGRLLAQSQTQSRIQVAVEGKLPQDFFEGIPGAGPVENEGDHFTFSAERINAATVELVKRLDRAQIELLDLHVHRPSLEDIYFEQTGRKYSKS